MLGKHLLYKINFWIMKIYSYDIFSSSIIEIWNRLTKLNIFLKIPIFFIIPEQPPRATAYFVWRQIHYWVVLNYWSRPERVTVGRIHRWLDRESLRSSIKTLFGNLSIIILEQAVGAVSRIICFLLVGDDEKVAEINVSFRAVRQGYYHDRTWQWYSNSVF